MFCSGLVPGPMRDSYVSCLLVSCSPLLYPASIAFADSHFLSPCDASNSHGYLINVLEWPFNYISEADPVQF